MRYLRNLPHRGSHLPVLMKLFQMTSGPILELGCGVYSSIYLHWACYPTKRRLVTYEDNPKFYQFIKPFSRDYHEIHCIRSWDELNPNEPWGIAFVDHGQNKRRYIEISKLTHSDYVVAHDAENSSNHVYQYTRIHPLFKYRFKYNKARPFTAIFSNKHNLSNIEI